MSNLSSNNTNINTNTNTKNLKEKGRITMERISATGILNKNYPDRDPESNYSKESQSALNILNAKFNTNKGGKRKSNKIKRKTNKIKRKSNKIKRKTNKIKRKTN